MGRGQNSRVRWIAVVIAVVAVIAIHDFAVPHGRGLAARAAIFAIDEYRAHVSPRLRGRVVCRFTPSCSAYGRTAIQKYGFALGSLKTAWRVARCGPWTTAGTHDEP